MEKALETIKKHIKDLERMADVFSFYGYFSSAAECKKANKKLNEAIAELEEAMNPKTCEGCKFRSTVKFVQVESETLECCSVCVRNCYDYYEQKANA